MPRNRTAAMASTETAIHIPFTAANCTVMWRFLIQKEGVLSGIPMICLMRYVLASTQMSPSNSPFSLRLGLKPLEHNRRGARVFSVTARRRQPSRCALGRSNNQSAPASGPSESEAQNLGRAHPGVLREIQDFSIKCIKSDDCVSVSCVDGFGISHQNLYRNVSEQLRC